MTTNLGTESGRSIGFVKDSGPEYRGVVRRYFRPEFLNRIDQVVCFSSLSEPVMRQIPEKELAELETRDGLVLRNIKLTWTDALINYLTEQGFDPRYGGRPLQRAIEKHVVGEISRRLLDWPDFHDAMFELDFWSGCVRIESAGSVDKD